ncbi:MAG: NAD-dependent epimerase/dehydratase family protein, partial [Chloroflexia bacterium]
WYPRLRALVTGAAGFIGSHLCEILLAAGHEVVGLDAFIPYYPREIKEVNLASFRDRANFTFYELDLRTDELAPALEGVNTVFHLAAMGGLVLSWMRFELYMTCNILATQRLLDAVRNVGTVKQFIYSSTSSIYGADVTGPETTPPNPVSPYGITKLAAEHLVQTYDRQFDVPSTILRYFSVYGPRQRPDMGYYLFINSILHDKPITVFGDGNQLRGNTYATDIARATELAHLHFRRGAVYNLGGSEEISANQVISLLETITGKKADVHYAPPRPGEQSRTLADTTLARRYLGFTPQVPLLDGLTNQVNWQRKS